MTNEEKIEKIKAIVEEWKKARDRFESFSESYPSDIVTVHYVLYSQHVAELENILDN